jgi:hypothetical protein
MAPQQLALSIYRGDSYKWSFTLFTDAAHTLPLDLTGATAKAEVRLKSGDPVLLTLACTITVPNKVDVSLTAADSKAITFTAAQWDLQITWTASGTVKTVVAGSVKIDADITDSSAGLKSVAEPKISAWEKRQREAS